VNKKRISQSLLTLNSLSEVSYLFRTLIEVQSLAFGNCIRYILNSEEFDFKTFFATVKAKNFDSIWNNQLTFRTDHLFCGLFKTRNMETMATGHEHQRAIRTTYFAFFLLYKSFLHLMLYLRIMKSYLLSQQRRYLTLNQIANESKPSAVNTVTNLLVIYLQSILCLPFDRRPRHRYWTCYRLPHRKQTNHNSSRSILTIQG
jgi:hypothetical protein